MTLRELGVRNSRVPGFEFFCLKMTAGFRLKRGYSLSAVTTVKIQLSDHFTYARLLRFTLPSIAMMIFTSIYSIVDGYFVSNYAGKTAFAAVNLIMPIIMILNTVGFMFGSGGTAVVAKTIGEGDREKANRYFSLFIYFTLALGIVICALGEIFARPIAMALGAEGELLEHCILYARVLFAATPMFILQVIFMSFFPVAEKPVLGFRVTMIAGVLNMILDAVLCILLPQEYKLLGAAVASAVSQSAGGIIPLIYFSKKNGSLLRLCKTQFDGCALIRACTNGSSEFMNSISMSVVGVLFNIQLMKYAGEDGVSAYGFMMYVSMIFTAIFVGYSMGTAPIFGYNDGAQNYTELKAVLRKSLFFIASSGLAMVLLGEVFAVPFAKMFVGYDAALTALTVRGFRIFALSFAFIGFGIFASGFFTAMNDGVTSAIISFVRTLVFESLAVLVLPLIFDIDGIWYSTVIAESLSLILGGGFLIAKRKKYHY